MAVYLDSVACFGLRSMYSDCVCIQPVLQFSNCERTLQTVLYAIGAIVTCFVPRILIGVVSAYVYRAVARKDKHQFFACGLAGVVGAMVNTILVMGCILLFFMQPYANVNGVLPSALWGIIGMTIAVNGVLEAIVTGILVVAIAKPLLLIMKKRRV